MNARRLKDRVSLIGAVDWERRLFDALIPLPDGTSYNSYLIQGSEKTAIIDTVDPSKTDVLMSQLEGIEEIDYIVSNHSEQDHSGSIPCVLEKYHRAKVVTSTKGKGMLMDLMPIPEDRIITVNDKDALSLGDKTLEFIYTPWVHWPETMSTYLREDNILFSCDFFGAHLATSDTFVTNRGQVHEAAKRYYAEIMMPFRASIRSNLKKLQAYKIDYIAPSHGPVYDNPQWIIDAQADWASEECKNIAVIPYVTMHGSTKQMVDFVVSALVDKGVRVQQFDLSVTDLGKLAMALVDAATIVLATPAVLVGAHPAVVYAAHLANALRPKLKFASIISSYGWGSQVKEQLIGLIPNLKVELLEPVICKGMPKEADLRALDTLADAILTKHKEFNLL
ncbi:MAG: FprA family A-type flavoprotein [Chloroflexi bacterium]|nr:FprA family A-type flavoprotein [Chloroflexota bacterium]